MELVVVVEEGDELALGRPRAHGWSRPRCRGSPRRRRDRRSRARRRAPRRYCERALVRRAVVGEAELPVGVGLVANRVDGAAEPGRIDVVDGRDDRDERPSRELRELGQRAGLPRRRLGLGDVHGDTVERPRMPSFALTRDQVVQQRVDLCVANIRIRIQVERGRKTPTRITTFPPACGAVVVEWFDPGLRDVRMRRSVILRVE